MQCVFDNPVHANGGCIFADPTTFLAADEKRGPYGGRFRDREIVDEYTLLAIREDEEMLILIRAFLEVIKWH